MNIYLGRERVSADPASIIGTGGEADVYRIAGGRALKLYKGPRHPDLRGDSDAQRAAKLRLDQHQHKLRAFPGNLPERVVAPEVLATDKRGGRRVVGYSMRLVDGADLLYRFSEPRVRRAGLSPARVIAALRDLWCTVSALHRAGVVIGDFNDLNVLVDGERCYLIDADSYQFGGYRCAVFNERFVDPLACDPHASSLVLATPHSELTDWYAFTVIVMRSLLCVGPYGGVYRPSDATRRVSRGKRPLHRITVFDPEVVYPKPAIHFRVLPDALLHHLRGVFEDDARGAFPATLLDSLRFTRCTQCGAEHARLVCPSCTRPSRRAPALQRVRGRVTVDVVFQTSGLVLDARPVGRSIGWLEWRDGVLWREDGADLGALAVTSRTRVVRHADGALVARDGRVSVVEPGAEDRVAAADVVGGETVVDAGGGHRYWISAGTLMRDDVHGDRVVGSLLPGQTRVWMGERFGFGFYRAGRLEVSFTFDAERRGIEEGLQRLGIRGALLDTHCVIGDDLAWLFLREETAGQRATRLLVLDDSGVVVAARDGAVSPDAFLEAGRSACAVGRFLFVATDDGIVRVECDGDSPVVTRTYPDTEPFVDAATRLVVCRDGLHAVGANQILKLTLR